MPHGEDHRAHRSNWLRAAVLGADDGLVTTSSLVVGVAAASASRSALFLVASAGMVAGALSMAAGEYVSVSTQSDAEAADLERERGEIEERPDAERDELERIYRSRGLDPALAAQVAAALTEHDALDSHARDELGVHERTRARPLQAALTSAAAYATGALPTVILTGVLPLRITPYVVAGVTLVLLPVLGAIAARLGGAPPLRGALRVAFWGSLAMLITSFVGRVFGAVG